MTNERVFQFKHIQELDGFRGTAITLVVLGRLLEFRAPTPELRNLAQHTAQLGVLLFFVLSGFLITGLLYRERNMTGSIDFKRFYVRRGLRLLPALVLYLSTVAILVGHGFVTDVPKVEFLECLFYARNVVGHSLTLGHFWSLSLEEQFYLLWPLTFFLFPLRRAPVVVGCICVAFMIWRGIAISLHLFSYEQGVYYVRPYFRFDSILIGGLIALCLCSSEVAYSRLRTLVRGKWGAALWVALFVWMAVGELFSRALHITISEILVSAALIHAVLRPDTFIAGILRSRVLRYLGLISYSLYLWQELFISSEPSSWGKLREFPLSLIIPFTIAVASYHFMEKPILQLKVQSAPQTRNLELRGSV